jgi:hypothetical protein
MRTLTFVAVLLGVAAAHADDPKYEYKDPNAPPPVDTKKPTLFKANASVGLVWLEGNSRSIGLSASGLFSAKHWNNEFTLNVGGAYVHSWISAWGEGGPIYGRDKYGLPNAVEADSAANWLLKLRYDRYFLTKNTVFVSFQSSGNVPAGFDYRIEPQVGYARILFVSPRQMLRGEIGYDYTFEHRVGDHPWVDYHSARLFAYYENKFTPYATFSEALEMLEAFNTPESFRLNSLTTLSSQIWKNFSLKLNFTFNFNNDPPLRPKIKVVDITTSGVLYSAPPDQQHFEKFDTKLDLVLAITFL